MTTLTPSRTHWRDCAVRVVDSAVTANTPVMQLSATVTSMGIRTRRRALTRAESGAPSDLDPRSARRRDRVSAAQPGCG